MKPILFNAEMVRAILEGRKTVTRRVVKPQPEARLVPGEKDCYIYRGIPCGLDGMTNFAPYRPDDILYVREPFWQCPNGEYIYKSDHNQAELLTWHPSIHMPREAARIFLRVTDVRVERLQDINEEQARVEGVEPLMMTADVDKPDGEKRWEEVLPALPRFPEVWNRTIKPADRDLYGWDANPYVWCVSFDKIPKEEALKHDKQ